MKKKYFILIALLIFSIILFPSVTNASADSLSDNINEQLGNLDFGQLEEFYNGLNINNGTSYIDIINSFLSGNFSLDIGSFSSYLFNLFTLKIKDVFPTLLGVIAIALLCGVIKSLKDSFFSSGVYEIVFLSCFCTIILLILGQLVNIFINAYNTIENISKIIEIMSPIILTLMVGSGGKVSASVYKPSVVFLSGGICNVILYVVMPIIAVIIIFGIISNLTDNVKLKKFGDLFSSVIKWVIGIIVIVFGLLISVQGIASSTYDGISIKVAKYAITNSIPIVGGLIKDGFDLVVAGSVVIKNSVGISVLVLLFHTIITPVITILAFSLSLKLVSAITETISDEKISNFCNALSKSINYILASILCVGLLLFIFVLLLMFSANAFL